MNESHQEKNWVPLCNEEMQFRGGSLFYKEGCLEIQPCNMTRRLWQTLCTYCRSIALVSQGHFLTVSRSPAQAFI